MTCSSLLFYPLARSIASLRSCMLSFAFICVSCLAFVLARSHWLSFALRSSYLLILLVMCWKLPSHLLSVTLTYSPLLWLALIPLWLLPFWFPLLLFAAVRSHALSLIMRFSPLQWFVLIRSPMLSFFVLAHRKLLCFASVCSHALSFADLYLLICSPLRSSLAFPSNNNSHELFCELVRSYLL